MKKISPNDTHYIVSGDARIYIECYGNKKHSVLLFLHGNGEDLHIFDPQISYFSKKYYVIAIDSRAHGKSERGKLPLDFNTLAGDVLSVLDVLQIKKAHILGFSDGANTALHLALLSPERLQSMILVGANYNSSGLRFLIRIEIYWVYLFLCFAAVFSTKEKRKKEIWNLMVHHPKLQTGDIDRIKTPCLVVTGENDMVTQKQNDEIHRSIINSERIILPGADHFLTSKKPEEFNRIASDFLDRIKQETANDKT